MSTLYYKKIDDIRKPFKILKLPLMGRLRKYWDDNISNKKRRAKFARALFVRLSKLNFKSMGRLIFQNRQHKYNFEFNARNTQFSSIYAEKYLEGYEPEIATLLDILVPSNGVFYDIGANYGYFSFYLASRPDFTGNIYAFEPHPQSYTDLTNIIQHTKLDKTIHPYPLAVYSEKKTFFVKPSGVRSGNFSLLDRDDNQKNTFKVQAECLNNLSIPHPDVMKIDVEGSEFDVLNGCSEILTHSHPFIIFESSLDFDNPSTTLAPFNILDSYGYSFFNLVWMKNLNKDKIFLLNTVEANKSTSKNLALNAFKKEDRFLFAQRLNILAIHKDHFPKILNHFNSLELKNNATVHF